MTSVDHRRRAPGSRPAQHEKGRRELEAGVAERRQREKRKRQTWTNPSPILPLPLEVALGLAIELCLLPTCSTKQRNPILHGTKQ